MKKALAPLAALALTTGCMVAERPYDNVDLDPERFAMPSNFSNLTDDGVRPVSGRLAGDIGPDMRAMNDVAQLNGMHDTGYTNLEVLVANDRGAAMALFDIQGGIDHPAFQPGERLVFANDAPNNTDEPEVTAIVCSGRGEPGNWDYDTQASRVEVEVEATENPEVLRYNFTTFADGDTATGHVDVVSPQ